MHVRCRRQELSEQTNIVVESVEKEDTEVLDEDRGMVDLSMDVELNGMGVIIRARGSGS